MNMQFDYVPNGARTDPRDMSRPWGRLTAKTNAGTSIIEATLWPDGAHILKIPARRTNLGAVVTASELAEFARMVASTAGWCADRDATELQGVELAEDQAPDLAAQISATPVGERRQAPPDNPYSAGREAIRVEDVPRVRAQSRYWFVYRGRSTPGARVYGLWLNDAEVADWTVIE